MTHAYRCPTPNSSTLLFDGPESRGDSSHVSSKTIVENHGFSSSSSGIDAQLSREYRVIDPSGTLTQVTSSHSHPQLVASAESTVSSFLPRQQISIVNSTANIASHVEFEGSEASTQSKASRISSKEAIRVIIGAITAQINSVQEMLNYLCKLVKAEKAVQQALCELVPLQLSDSSSQSSYNSDTRNARVQRFPLISTRRHRTGLSALTSPAAMDAELGKILQSLLTSTNQQARAYSTRALFHKVVTVAQLESLAACQQCMKRAYMDCEGELQSQGNQYALKLKSCEKKYSKYAEHLATLRLKLTRLYDKRSSYHRKTAETLMTNLENATKRLHLLHNEYLMSLWTANHFQQWLHAQLRPCLLNGIERTMRLTCEVVQHLLVFGGETSARPTPLWLEDLQTDRNLMTLLAQNR